MNNKASNVSLAWWTALGLIAALAGVILGLSGGFLGMVAGISLSEQVDEQPPVVMQAPVEARSEEAGGRVTIIPAATTEEPVENFLGRPDFPVNGIADVPGGTRDECRFDEPPTAWIATDGSPSDRWGVPYVLEGPLPHEAGGVNYRQHHAFELAPGSVYTATWLYSSFCYYNGDLDEDITHNTWLQQVFIWGASSSGGRTQYDGLGIWGPMENATVTVTYYFVEGGEQTCTGASAELIPGVPFKIRAQNDGTTGAIFGIGPWDESKTTLVGAYPPECRPDMTNQ